MFLICFATEQQTRVSLSTHRKDSCRSDRTGSNSTTELEIDSGRLQIETGGLYFSFVGGAKVIYLMPTTTCTQDRSAPQTTEHDNRNKNKATEKISRGGREPRPCCAHLHDDSLQGVLASSAIPFESLMYSCCYTSTYFSSQNEKKQ